MIQGHELGDISNYLLSDLFLSVWILMSDSFWTPGEMVCVFWGVTFQCGLCVPIRELFQIYTKLIIQVNPTTEKQQNLFVSQKPCTVNTF